MDVGSSLNSMEDNHDVMASFPLHKRPRIPESGWNNKGKGRVFFYGSIWYPVP